MIRILTSAAAVLLAAVACAPVPLRTTVEGPPGLPTAVMPLGLPGDTRPCQTARADLRVPVEPVPVIPAARMRQRWLPGTVPDAGSGRVSVYFAVPSPRGDLLALMILAGGPRLSLRDPRTGAARGGVDSVWAPSGAPGIAWSPDGRWIAVAGQDGDVAMVSVPRRRVAARLPHTRYRADDLPPILGAAPGTEYRGVESVAFSPDGGAVVSAGEDGHVILWDVQTRRPRWIHDLRGGRGAPPRGTTVAFLPDGRLLVSSVRGVEVWSPERGEVVGRLFTPTGAVPQLRDSVASTLSGAVIDAAVSRDGRLVAVHGRSVEFRSASQQSTASDWIETWWWGECPDRGRRIQMPYSIGPISVSPDARWIAGVSQGTAHVWDARTGLERYRIQHTDARPLPGGRVMEVAFSADGRSLYTVHNAERPLAVWTLDGAPETDGDDDGRDRPRPRGR